MNKQMADEYAYKTTYSSKSSSMVNLCFEMQLPTSVFSKECAMVMHFGRNVEIMLLSRCQYLSPLDND